MTEHDRLEVGYIGKAHGLGGELVVKLTSNRTERLKKGSVLFANGTELTVTGSRPHQDRWLVRFASIGNRNQAEELRGSTLTGEPLEDPDTLWVHELVGSEVVERDGTRRGTVEEVQDNPASDLLVLDTGALVPLTFLVEQTDNQLIVDTPPGLFEAQQEEE